MEGQCQIFVGPMHRVGRYVPARRYNAISNCCVLNSTSETAFIYGGGSYVPLDRYVPTDPNKKRGTGSLRATNPPLPANCILSTELVSTGSTAAITATAIARSPSTSIATISVRPSPPMSEPDYYCNY